MAPLLVRDRPLHRGCIVARPNRCVVRVRTEGGGVERAFLGAPGVLDGIGEPGGRCPVPRSVEPSPCFGPEWAV